MRYDFTTYHPRKGIEAAKWDSMDPATPDGIVPLSVADMELLSPPQIINALRETAEFGMWGYTFWGEPYANAMKHWMKTRHNWEIERDWIVQVNGVVQGLYAAVRAFSNPGDGVLMLTPVYYPFYRAVLRNNRTVVDCPLVLADGHYSIDFDDFAEKAKQAKIFILCNPHNPVGRVWSPDELRRLADICLENNVLMISDDIHFDIIMPGYAHTCLPTLDAKYADNCIFLCAASKTFSLAALCVANAIIPNADIRAKFDDEVNISGCYTYSIFGIRALEVGYMECADWVDEMCAHIAGNYAYLKDFMAKNFPDIRVFDLEGTYLAWLDCRCLGLSGEALANKLVKEAHLYFDDGVWFGAQGDGFERINLACPRQVLVDALERFRVLFA